MESAVSTEDFFQREMRLNAILGSRGMVSSQVDAMNRQELPSLLHPPEDKNGPCSFHGEPSSQLPSQPA
jgi:hypothetical protein